MLKKIFYGFGVLILWVVVINMFSGPRMTREEFRDAAVGKDHEEILATFGNPEEISYFGGYEIWMYHNLTHDPRATRGDLIAEIYFIADLAVATKTN